MTDECLQLESGLLAWINAQPNSDEIKTWILSEHQRRVEWQHETGFSDRAMTIENDVLDALFYMAGLAMPVYDDIEPKRFRLWRPHEYTRYGAAFLSLIIGLKRDAADTRRA
jgi:hypothetical protein